MAALSKEDIYTGLLLTGSPSEIARYIGIIIDAGYGFEPHYDPYLIGDAIVVIAANGETAEPIYADTAAATPSPAPEAAWEDDGGSVEPLPAKGIDDHVAPVAEAVEEILDAVQEELEPGTVEEEAPEPKPAPARRGRKPKAPTQEV